jgi:hypothetical protein
VDPFLRRVERTAIVACLAMAVAAMILSGGQLGAAGAVLAGGLLIGVSYWTIGSGVSALGAVSGDADSGSETVASARPPWAITLAKVVGRYALLALLAYVMISRLRLHPVGLLAGASSVVAAASVEALRLLLKKS